jgi:hypothetical protein
MPPFDPDNPGSMNPSTPSPSSGMDSIIAFQNKMQKEFDKMSGTFKNLTQEGKRLAQSGKFVQEIKRAEAVSNTALARTLIKSNAETATLIKNIERNIDSMERAGVSYASMAKRFKGFPEISALIEERVYELGKNFTRLGNEPIAELSRQIRSVIAVGSDLKNLNLGSFMGGALRTMGMGLAGAFGTPANVFQPMVTSIQAGAQRGQTPGAFGARGAITGMHDNIRENMIIMGAFGYSVKEASDIVLDFAKRGLSSGLAVEAAKMSRVFGMSASELGPAIQMLHRRMVSGSGDVEGSLEDFSGVADYTKLSVNEVNDAFQQLVGATFGVTTGHRTVTNIISKFGEELRTGAISIGTLTGAMAGPGQMQMSNIAGMLAFNSRFGNSGAGGGDILGRTAGFLTGSGFGGKTGADLMVAQAREAATAVRNMGGISGGNLTGRGQVMARQFAGQVGLGGLTNLPAFNSLIEKLARGENLSPKEIKAMEEARKTNSDRIARFVGVIEDPIRGIAFNVAAITNEIVAKKVGTFGDSLAGDRSTAEKAKRAYINEYNMSRDLGKATMQNLQEAGDFGISKSGMPTTSLFSLGGMPTNLDAIQKLIEEMKLSRRAAEEQVSLTKEQVRSRNNLGASSRPHSDTLAAKAVDASKAPPGGN